MPQKIAMVDINIYHIFSRYLNISGVSGVLNIILTE